MAAVSLFWDINMAAVTSCENTLYLGIQTVSCRLLLWIARMNIDWNQKKSSQFFKFLTLTNNINNTLFFAWSDHHQFSPNNIHLKPREKVTRINKIITLRKVHWYFIRSVWRICIRILGLLRLMKKIHKPVRAICQRGEKRALTWFKGMGGVGGWLVS